MRYTKGIIAAITTKTQNNKKTKTYDDIITFDTESSRITDNLVCTYLWSACIGGEYVYGRTPQECYDFFSELASYDGKWYVWVQCLGYDSVYLEDVLGGFDDVFAISKYRPIRIKWQNITFRCTYAISDLSLKDTAELYNLKHKKGEMNHDLIRHYETELTDDDWEYVMNDVFVLYDYVTILRDIYDGLDRIPLTFTSCARASLREYIWLYTNCNGESPNFNKLLSLRQDILSHAPKDSGAYNSARNTYHGAYNFVNPEYLGVTITAKDGAKIYSADMHSAYPFNMASEQFPNKLIKLDKSRTDIFNFTNAQYAIADFVLADIELKDGCIPSLGEYQVEFACFKKERRIVNNQIISCKYCKVTLSTLDFALHSEMYKFKVLAVSNIYVATTSYLPLGYIMLIKDMYNNKTLATDKVKKIISKLVINSLSGSWAYDYTKADVTYEDGKWAYDKDLKKDITQIENKIIEHRDNQTKRVPINHKDGYKDDKMSYSKYQWAGALTAYTRRNLLLLDKKIGLDCIISNDTDCAKVYLETQEQIDNFNKVLKDYDEWVDDKLQKMCDYMNRKFKVDLKVSDFRPTDYDSTLGHIPIEHDIYKFKQLKKKTYLMCEIVEHEGKEYHVITPVISGANKQIALETLLLNIKPEYQTLKGDTILSHYSEADLDLIFERFNYELIIPGATVGNHYTRSTDEDIEVTDYNGKTITLHGVTRGLYIEPRDFSLSNMPDLDALFLYKGLGAGNGTLGC